MFGAAFRKQHFSLLDENVLQVNHGAYGLAPDCAFEAARKAVDREWEYPERYLLSEVPNEYRDVVKEVGEVLGCDYHNLALVENAMTAVNIVLRSFPFKRGDKIAYIKSTVFSGCEKTILFLEDYLGIVPVPMEITYPIEDADLVELFAKVISQEKPKMAFFDTISSKPAVRVPFEAMVRLCKQNGVVSYIDGAHSIGAIPLSLGDLQPDFYVSNLHKWLYVPRPCAVMYVNPQFHNVVQTFPITEAYEKGAPATLLTKFAFIGPTNYSHRSAIKTALEFRRTICGGEQKIYDYCHGLAVEVGEKLSRKYATSYLENSTKTLTTVMVNVELPNLGLTAQEYSKNSSLIKELGEEMLRKKAFVPTFVHNNKIYARFSCQVYNEYEDFERAMEILLETFKTVLDKHAQDL